MADRRLIAAAAAAVVIIWSFLLIPPAETYTTDVADVAETTTTTTTTTTTASRRTTTAATTDRARQSTAAITSQQPQQTPVHLPHDIHTDDGMTGPPVHPVHNTTGGHGDEHKCPPEGEEGLRYKVAKFDFHHVQFPMIVALWILFVTYAKIAFHSCEALEKRVPESCLLIVIGVILGIITFFASDHHEIIEFNTQLFFTVILPPIIMEAAYFMPTRAFFDQLGTILLHAVIATLLNTFLIGLSLWGIGQAGVFGDDVCLPLLHALVFASLLAAVDPVAVLAVFESIHVNQLLYIIVFGESLLNDGVAVVLYHVFSEMSKIGGSNVNAVDVVLGIVSFFVVVVGSVGVGTLMGLAGSFSARFTHHMRVMEPMVVVIVPYLAFLVAEMFHLSGIVSCMACGMAMRKYVEINISSKSKTTIKYVMKMLASVAEAVIFMFLGISAVSRSHVWNTEFVLLALFFCLAYRAIVVVVLTNFANLLRSTKIDGISQFVMAYGGLRGAIAFALAVVLDRHTFLSRQLFITTTIVVVYFTNIVLGTTMQPLVKILRVKTQQKIEITMSLTIGERVLDHVMVGVEAISQERGHHLMRERFLKADYYVRPYITGQKRVDKVHRPGAQILQVYKHLTEQDALTLTKMPDNPEALLRWNASLRNIATIVRNHTSGDLQRAYSTASLVAMETPANDEHDHDDDATANSEEEMPEQPKTPTSPIYNITLAPLSPDMFSNTNGRLDAPEGVRHSRSFTNLEQLPESNQKPPLRRTASTRSLPGGAAGAKQRPQSVKPADPAGDVKTHARHLKAGRPESSREAGGSMRDKGGRRRFRPGWMTNEAEEGVDNPAFNLEPVVSATFSIGDPEEAEPNVAITVTDFDKQDTSMV